MKKIFLIVLVMTVSLTTVIFADNATNDKSFEKIGEDLLQEQEKILQEKRDLIVNWPKFFYKTEEIGVKEVKEIVGYIKGFKEAKAKANVILSPYSLTTKTEIDFKYEEWINVQEKRIQNEFIEMTIFAIIAVIILVIIIYGIKNFFTPLW